MNAPKTLKPKIAVVIPLCDSTPYDPILPRPHVIAQQARKPGTYELWNIKVTPDTTTMEIFKQFAADYLLDPQDADSVSLMPLANIETKTHSLQILTASRLFRWQDFAQLDNKKIVPVTMARKKLFWSKRTQQAMKAAYYSEGLRLILNLARLVQQGRMVGLQAPLWQAPTPVNGIRADL